MKFSTVIREAEEEREIKSVKFGKIQFTVGEDVLIKRAPGDDFERYKVKNIERDDDEDTARSSGNAYRITTEPVKRSVSRDEYVIDNQELDVIEIKQAPDEE